MADNNQKKQFVKSSVKAVAVLMIICLVCGILLALCNDLLYVSDAVRFDRAMKKIYPEFTTDASFNGRLDSQFATNATYGNVLSVAKSTDGTYVLETKGVGGFKEGTVTLYVAVKADAKIAGWSIKEAEGQTFIGNFNSSHFSTWYIGMDVSNDLALGSNYVTGTTLSSTAINNAVNMAAYYCRNALGVGKNPESEAMQAVVALLTETDYAAYTLTRVKDTVNISSTDKLSTIYNDGDSTIKYIFSGKGDSGEIMAFVYGIGDADEIVVIKNSIKNDERTVVAKTDGITSSLETKVTSYYYTVISVNTSLDKAFIAEAAVDSTKIVYTVSGISDGYVPSTYVLTVTIEKDGEGITGKVTAIAVVKDGFVDGAPTQDNANKLLTSLVGATTATVDNMYAELHVGGATQSANLITAAVKVALAHYDATFATEEG